MKKKAGYTINISSCHDDINQLINNNIENNDNNKEKTKEKRVKINLDLQNKSELNLNRKKFKKSILKTKRSFNKNNNLLTLETDKREKLNTSNRVFFNVMERPKSSLNVKNNITNKSFANKSIFDKTTYKSFHNKKLLLKKSKKDFLKLINPNSNIKKSKISGADSLFFGKDFDKELEEDSLNLIEINLQNKILDMGKNAEFSEFEINPLEVSINNRLNLRKKKPKLTHKLNKKDSTNIKIHKTVIHKNMIQQLNSNMDNSSGDLLLSQDNKSFMFNKTKNISNKRIISNITHQKSLNKKSLKNINNHKNNKNNISHYYKINVIGNNIAGRRSSINHFIKSSFKSTIINRSKTASHSKVSSSSLKKSSSINKIEIPIIKIKKSSNNIEKFRVLSHRKLVYDSFDDEEIIEDTIADNFYINPDDKVLLAFDSVIFIVAFWCILYKPLKLVLNNCDVKNEIISFNIENISNILIDLIFIIDLIINFFKAYYNFDEQLVKKSEKIILNYIKGYFVIDFISAIPYYSIFKLIAYKKYYKLNSFITCSKYYNHKINDVYQVMELLKIIKLIKSFTNNNILINFILNTLNQFTFFESWSFLLSNIFVFLLILHLTACTHIFISSTAFPNWIIYKNLHESSFSIVYLSSIYFLITTVTSVGYGDIIGNSFNEIIFQIILLLIGIIAYSWLISSLSNYVKENNEQNEIFNQKLSILNEIKLEHPIMTKDLYDRIHLHLEYINLRQKKDKSSLIDCLPHSIKKPLLYEMYKPIIDNFSFFKNCKNSEFANRVISKLKPVLAVKNDLLLEQGEIIEDTIFVKQGRLSLEVKIDTDHPEKSIEKLLNEEYFFGIENNELYQKKAMGGFFNMTSNYNQSFINKKNLYNLYSGNANADNNYKKVKSIITNINGENEIQKRPTLSINYIHLRILDIRKNEHFGSLLMFLNKRSPLTLRVKTKKAELFFLKKIDAIEISTSYPNIWKRVNKKSFHNLKQIKIVMKKIIKHFCETYGINFDFSSNIYSFKKKDLQKFNQSLQKYNILPNQLMDPRRASVDVRNAQLKMFQNFPKQTRIVATKTNYEKNIEKLIPEKFELNERNNINFNLKDMNNDKNNKNDNNKNNNNGDEPKKTSSSLGSPMNCSVSMIKISKKDTMLGYGHPIYIRDNNDNLEMSYRANGKSVFANENNESKKTLKNINQNNENISNSNQKIIQYGEEETNNLMRFFGTPYYPEDINDEVYPGEIFGIISPRANNILEQEYTSVNNLLLSYDTNKNNTQKMKPKSIAHPSFEINNRSNNFTINNNYITNNVINNISTKNNVNSLSIFHFDISIKSDKSNKENKNLKLNTEKKIRLDFSIFKNSFEISSNNINGNLYINNNFKKRTNNVNNINNNLKIECIPPKHRRNNSCVNITNKKINGNKNNDKYSSNYSDVSSYNLNSNSDNDANDYFYDAQSKKLDSIDVINTPKSILKEDENNCYNDDNNNNDSNEKMQIRRNMIIKINAKYENINIITKGEYSKSKNLQKFIKKILIKKILKHKNENKFTQKTETLEKVYNNFEKNNTKKQLIQKKKTYQRRQSLNKKPIIQKKQTIQNNLTIDKNSNIQKNQINRKYQSIQNNCIKASKCDNNTNKLNKLMKIKTLSKNIIPEKFSHNNFIKENVKKEKLRKTELKNLFNKHMISEIEEKKDKNTLVKKKNISRIKDASEISCHSLPKRRKTKKNGDDFFLDYVNRNIRDDNAVLNNPGQFYNGFFIDIMKRVNEGKIKQKSEIKDN